MHRLSYYASAHIYSSDLDRSPYHPDWDKLIVHLHGAIQRQEGIKGWFFVRYRDPDPHIRIRLRIDDSQPPYCTRRALRLAAASIGIHEEPHSKLPSVQLPRARWLVWSPYQREVQRYGGLVNLVAVEQVFEATSATVADYLAENPDQAQTARLLEAASMACDLVRGTNEGAKLLAQPFLRLAALDPASLSRTGGSAESLLSHAIRRMLADRAGTYGREATMVHHEGVTGAAERTERNSDRFHLMRLDKYLRTSLVSCLPSLVHMLWNRMGLTRELETIVARQLVLATMDGSPLHEHA
jgi:thiopeptide-type bacteriocin biosynthesis protein